MFEEGEYYREKINTIVDSFLCNKIEIRGNDFTKNVNELNLKIEDNKNISKVWSEGIKSYIQTINVWEASQVSKIQLYKFHLIREKCIYENLNKLIKGNNFFIGAFWIPECWVSAIDWTRDFLNSFKHIKVPHLVKREDHDFVPPTFIRTNDFTQIFQEITNTYGVPSYKEANPSYFSMVTFPFLFGVMFGDAGLGMVLFLFGWFMTLQKDFLHKSFLSIFIPYSYILLMMGFFSTFWGILYNDMMSIPIERYNSCIEIDRNTNSTSYL